MKSAPNSEFSETFIELKRNRMAMSYFKYGLLKDAYPHKVNAIESLLLCLKKYEDTGNTEYLVDVSNYAMIEFMHPGHPKAHFKALESKDSAGRAAYDTNLESTTAKNDQLSDSEYKELRKNKK